MAKKMSIPRTCVNCGNTFIAQTTVTRFCSKNCNSQYLKNKIRQQKIDASIQESHELTIQSKIALLDSDKMAYKVSTVAKALDTTPKTIYGMINSGRIRATNLSTRNTRIAREEVIAFLMQKNAPVSSPLKPIVEKRSENAAEILTKENTYSVPVLTVMFDKNRGDLYTFLKRHKVPKIKIGKEVFFSQSSVEKLYKWHLKPKEVGHDKERQSNLRLAKKPLTKQDCYSIPECVERFKRTRANLYAIFNRRLVPKLRDGHDMYYSKKAVDKIYMSLKNEGKV